MWPTYEFNRDLLEIPPQLSPNPLGGHKYMDLRCWRNILLVHEIRSDQIIIKVGGRAYKHGFGSTGTSRCHPLFDRYRIRSAISGHMLKFLQHVNIATVSTLT